MGLTTDRNDEGIKSIKPDGQQESYLVLSDEERAKGFVRPVRTQYRHVGCRPVGETRPLTFDEHERFDKFGYELFEPYDPPQGSVIGRYWTKEQLLSGCGCVTTMAREIAETYARDPKFYGATFCSHCKRHLPVGAEGEFVWDIDGSRVGT